MHHNTLEFPRVVGNNFYLRMIPVKDISYLEMVATNNISPTIVTIYQKFNFDPVKFEFTTFDSARDFMRRIYDLISI